MLPVFECSKSLFEGRANVTEQVSETVTNWGRLCRPRIKHILCGPEIRGREREFIIKLKQL